ncbi:MAG TPA: type VI secretion system tip protein TssI/VgrG, partial [Polyangiaceae bacterium]|nr:type VI secretion system tip protein TssI/VgrG [Polyangiaceae bacterium]
MLINLDEDLASLTVAGQKLELESVRGTIAVGELFEFSAHLATSMQVGTNTQKLLSQPFVLKIHSRLDETLSVHGVVAACHHHEDGDKEGYVLELRPNAYPRVLRRNHRVFQDATAKAIISDVLNRSGTDIGPVEWALHATYAQRPYVVQAGESDWAFIERISAREGIYYYFRFEADKTVLVFADDSPAAPGIAEPLRIPVRDASSLSNEEAILQSHHQFATVTEQSRVRCYEPYKVADVMDEAASRKASEREYYSAPDEFLDSSDGQHKAKTLVEAFGVSGRVLSAKTTVLRLIPGYHFTLAEHDVSAFNIDYFITGLTLFVQRLTTTSAAKRKRRNREAFSLRITAIPLDTPYRSPVPQPVFAPGPQTARVVGPAGEEIHTNDTGQIRAQFYWDREGKQDHTASTLMRVGQFPLAGSMMLPRIHWDQLIGFTSGHVDAPVVLGHLYDSIAPVPYALPANKTRTAWQTNTTPADGSSNEIRYEDKAGEEEIFLNASYDMTYEVGKDSSVTVGTNHTTEIGVNQSCTIGSNQSMGIGGKHEVSIGTAETLTVSGSRTVSIGGNESATIGATRATTVTGGVTLDTSGGRSVTAGTMMMTAATMGVERVGLGTS